MSDDIESKFVSDNIDDFDEIIEPAGERWDPVGASNDHDIDYLSCNFTDDSSHIEISRIKNLEEEQELLTSSLLALTSHFAQVQFRLRQIVDAPHEERDLLLQNLEEFAFRGIPEINQLQELGITGNIINLMEHQRHRQHELIKQLKTQLEDLEKYAYESGEIVLPQSLIVEKQKVIIDELKNKLNFNLNEFDLPQLTPENLRNQVDTALGELTNPLKMKEQLVSQLKTQIIDLERFITFLQGETKDVILLKKKNLNNNLNCKCLNNSNLNINDDEKFKTTSDDELSNSSRSNSTETKTKTTTSTGTGTSEEEKLNNKAFTLMNKASTLLQIFAVTQLGCGTSRFQKNTLKKTTKGNHWGDIRAQLEVDIQEVLGLVQQLNNSMITKTNDKQIKQKQLKDDNINNKFNDIDIEKNKNNTNKKDVINDKLLMTNIELTNVVRKNFAITLKKLIQHGLRSGHESNSLVPFIGCFQHQNQIINNDNDSDNIIGHDMHAWELIIEYYHIKNGDKYNETPARKLSQSFNLDIQGGGATSNKQSLLSTIGTIIAIHSPYKRSYNTHFKAFVCAGLNSQKLIQWLHLIFQSNELITTYYANWSYVARTEFRDALKSMDKLSKYKFDLPVDLAVRQFQNIKDVFM